MPITITSNKLLEKLRRMRSAANVDSFVAQLRVPDDLFWWKFLEFGTGSRGDVDTGGYTIEAINGKMLHFFDVALGKERFEQSIYMPGIPAFHMITSIYGDIQKYQKEFIQEAFKRSDYSLEGVKELVYLEMLPHIKEMIIDSFQENLPNHTREFGRLNITATQAFEAGLEVV